MSTTAQDLAAQWPPADSTGDSFLPDRALRARRAIVTAASVVLLVLATISIACFFIPHRPLSHLFTAVGASVAALLISFVEKKRSSSEARAQASLRDSHARQRLLLRALDNANDYIAVTDLEDRIIYANRALLDAFEYTEAELIGQSTAVLRSYRPDAGFAQEIRDASLHDGWSGEFWTLSRSGRKFLLSLRTAAVTDSRGRALGLVGVARDVTAQKKASAELQRSNRALRAMVECRQKMAQAKSETELLHSVCQVLVNLGGYRIAWIGSLEHDPAKTVVPLVAAGCGHAQLNRTRISWGASDGEMNPIAAAVSTGEATIGRSSSLRPHCDVGSACNNMSCVVLPLRRKEEVFAVIVLFSDDVSALDEEELHLLKELADDVAFGVHAMRTEAARDHMVTELAASETRFRTLIEDAPIAISIGRGTERFYVNRAYLELFAIAQAEDIIGRPISERWAPVSRPEVDDYFQKRLLGFTSSASLEGTALRQDGTEFMVHVDVAEVQLPDGPATMSFISDISDRMRAEEGLRKAEEEYRTIFEQAVEGIYRSSPQGKSIAANSAFAKILGYESPLELVGSITDSTSQMWADPEDRVRFVRELEKTGAVRGYECRCLRKDGSTIWISLNCRVVRDAAGKSLYYEGFIEDISRRRQLEEQFLHSQKMEAVGRLAGGVAHDFNNLLGVITGYAELIREDSAVAALTKQRLAQIEKAAHHAIEVTRQLLAFSRKQVLQPRTLVLNTLVNDAMKMLSRVLGEDIEVVALLEPHLAAVQADPTSVEQVILNLAINARDAMPRGGTLSLETSNVELDGAIMPGEPLPPGEYVLLTVTDTGIGMDVETQKHIFEPFFTTKGLGRGTGLGLSTVYGIVKQTGGHIRVYSETGVGTTFKVYFPRTAGFEKTELAPQRGEIPAESETILLVEDDPQLLRLNSELLSSLGYCVIEAANASEAFEASARATTEIDLMMTDIVMPGLNGKELAHRLRPLRPMMRVLYVSGYSENILASKNLPAGSAFLQKPFSRNALAKKLRELLDGTSPISTAA